MIKSMTGFSKVEFSELDFRCNIEIRSVNGRYLEVNAKMPRQLNTKEYELREQVKKILQRGTVSVYITVEKLLVEEPTELPSLFDETIALHYYKSLDKLKKSLKIKDAITLENVLRFSSSFEKKVVEEDYSNQIWAVVSKGLNQALQQLEKMRLNEGKEIAKDIRNRIKFLEQQIDLIEPIATAKIPEEREKMRQKVAQMFENEEIDEQRIQMEILILADKIDITEEIVRMRSHIKFFNDSLKAPEPSGRKLNFLLQEMHREINTIGSKSNDITISHSVVGMKEELERIREQVQNIE
jgi:uncharacterized protein (TIGR00255 family)